MKAQLKDLRPVAVMVASAALLGGCAAMKKDEAMSTERTLSAAGFQMKFADTPQRSDELTTLVQRMLVPRNKDGEIYYVYADSEYCKCLYVGTEQAYQRYQKLAIQQELAQETIQAAEMNENAAMNWGMWGGWGPWW